MNEILRYAHVATSISKTLFICRFGPGTWNLELCCGASGEGRIELFKNDGFKINPILLSVRSFNSALQIQNGFTTPMSLVDKAIIKSAESFEIAANLIAGCGHSCSLSNIVLKAQLIEEPTNKCACEIRSLMNRGCQCGGS